MKFLSPPTPILLFFEMTLFPVDDDGLSEYKAFFHVFSVFSTVQCLKNELSVKTER